MESISVSRSRIRLGVSLIAVMALGLASREFPELVPAFLGKYPGDALWALVAFLGWALLKPHASVGFLAVAALATAYGVEFSQCYRADWLNHIRSTTMGHAVLGSTFSWFDMAAYTVGVLVGASLDALLVGAFGFAPRPPEDVTP